MSRIVEAEPVSRKKTSAGGGSEGDKPESSTSTGLTTIKVRVDLHRVLWALANHHEMDMVDYVDHLLRPLASQLYIEMGQEIVKGAKKKE